MDFLITVHSLNRWLVLVAMLVALWTAISRRSGEWTPASDKPFAVAAVLFDIQVALGLVIWFGSQAWGSGAFFAFIHPGFMLVALGVYHVAVARARKAAGSGSYRTLLIGTVIALALVLVAIPWAS